MNEFQFLKLSSSAEIGSNRYDDDKKRRRASICLRNKLAMWLVFLGYVALWCQSSSLSLLRLSMHLAIVS
jgi:hypothetical protein